MYSSQTKDNNTKKKLNRNYQLIYFFNYFILFKDRFICFYMHMNLVNIIYNIKIYLIKKYKYQVDSYNLYGH